MKGVELRQLSPAVSAELDKIIGGRLNGYVLVTGHEMFSDVPNYAIRTDISDHIRQTEGAYGLAQRLDINAFTTFRDRYIGFFRARHYERFGSLARQGQIRSTHS